MQHYGLRSKYGDNAVKLHVAKFYIGFQFRPDYKLHITRNRCVITIRTNPPMSIMKTKHPEVQGKVIF